MSKTSKIILITIVATCLLLGLGYAAIQNITLNITGNVAAQVNSENFKVRFIGTPIVSDGIYATAKIVDDTNATIEVSGLTSKGQKVTASYDIKNESGDLSADLNVLATTTNMEYFTISSKLGKQSLVAGETTNVLVTVELTKTPISGPVNTDIDIELTAIPVQPGEEGKTEGITDFSQTMTGLTSYGFFAGQVYSTEPVDGRFQSAIFYEDGSMEHYRDGKFVDLYPAGTAIYSDNTIDVSNFTGVEDSIVTVSNEGKKLDFLGEQATIDEDFFEIYGLEEGTYYGRLGDDYVYKWLRTMPYEGKTADKYLNGQYEYTFSEHVTYGEGWACDLASGVWQCPEGFETVSLELTTYDDMLSNINGYPLITLNFTFMNCVNLTKSPKIPEGVKKLYCTYSYCENLVNAPVIPSSVEEMYATFNTCTGLRGNVEINCAKLTDGSFCFQNVEMKYITLTGSASSEIKNTLKKTGVNEIEF